MRQSLVPVLLLAAVALSSSNVLPMMSTDPLESITTDGQQNDNILSNRYNTRNVLNNLFYTVPVGTLQSNRLLKKLTKYMNTNKNQAEESFDDIVNEDDNYDDEGFRKEQWHNYPRQLDRLHEYLLNYQNRYPKPSTDADDPGPGDYTSDSKEKVLGDILTNEYLLDSNEDIHNIYDSAVAASNPLLILKVHLACLNNRLKNSGDTKSNKAFEYMNEKGIDNQEENVFTNEINPAVIVKREGVTLQEAETSGDNFTDKKNTVNKRLFSLWSRLQSLSHKGHELPHRRHLAFYGFPEGEGGGALTAETRATLMRPPGSPLRWG